MADSDKLDSDGLGRVDGLGTAKQAETAEGADVVNRTTEDGTDAAEADLTEVDDASARRAEENVKDVAAKGSDEDRGPKETPVKGKRGRRRTSKKDATKGLSKEDGSSKEGATEKGSKTRRKQKESSAESSKKGSKKSSGDPEKGTKRSTEEKAAEKKASSKEHKPARVKRLQSPEWWVSLPVTLMIVGFVIVITAYISGGSFPIEGLGNGNLSVGLGFMLTGFLMTVGRK